MDVETFVSSCDGRCYRENVEVAKLRHSEEPHHGNSILCHQCWDYEMSWRKDRNEDLGNFAQYEILSWATANGL